MKTLPLALLLLLVCFSARAQTPVVEKNIRDCFKHSSKTPADFDWCVADEFRRVREEKEYRELRAKVGKDPNGGCGKQGAYNECFNEVISDLRETAERLYDGSGSGGDSFYYPPVPSGYRYRFYYLRRYYPIYPRLYVPRYRHWRY